jgi:wyosine [tRNA(Phe)-imidazoG37] synthetase (radical SAM superfamily)
MKNESNSLGDAGKAADIAFGPVPSRRLGRSLGINHIPAKICSYSCAYCQLGRTIKLQAQRRVFFEPDEIVRQVREKVGEALRAGEAIDYLTFVPDGEPTLDVNLGRAIRLLRSTGPRIAVITNGSLLWRADVREDLAAADWVSVKVDAVREGLWRRLDRPHGSLRLSPILDGMLAFSKAYHGELATETMLVRGANDSPEVVREIAGYVGQLRPAMAYVSVPIRPPAEAWVYPPDEGAVNRAYQIMREQCERVEYLIGYEGNGFAATGDAAGDLLAIAAVHPMREDAVRDYLTRAKADWALMHRLLAQGQLTRTVYQDHVFYVRTLGARSMSGGARDEGACG